MADLELALAASARSWVDSLHRFLADHGGARVRAVVMGPDVVASESYDVLIIDDVCSFLTPRLVEQVRRQGRMVVGVFDTADGDDAKRRLLECGVDDVVEAEASPEEFMAVVSSLRKVTSVSELAEDPLPLLLPRGRGQLVVVGAPPGGCGATEIALGLAALWGAVLVDADDIAPGVAQRLGVPLHPNIRTAIDIVHHHSGNLEDATTGVGPISVVSGLADGSEWQQLRPGEVEAVIDELLLMAPVVVVNVGSGLERPHLGEGRHGLARAMVSRADVLVGVGLAHPVAVTRLIRWVHEAFVLAPETQITAVVNRLRRAAFVRSELAAELGGALPGVSVRMLPDDPRVEEAAWAGRLVTAGPFRRSLTRFGEDLVA